MTKKTKMLLGVGAVAVVGYLVYKQMNKTKSFVKVAPQKVFSAVGSKIPAKPLCKLGFCVNGFCWDNNEWQSCKTDSTTKNFSNCDCNK